MAENIDLGSDPVGTGSNVEATIQELNRNSVALLNTTNVLTDLLLQLPEKLTASISSLLVQQRNIPENSPSIPKPTITG